MEQDARVGTWDELEGIKIFYNTFLYQQKVELVII